MYTIVLINQIMMISSEISKYYRSLKNNSQNTLANTTNYQCKVKLCMYIRTQPAKLPPFSMVSSTHGQSRCCAYESDEQN